MEMSDGSNSYTKVLVEPLNSIGAQDLLKVGYGYYGYLRKQGKLERLIGGSRKWKQKFVIISQGCMYCFKDEYAEKPMSAFSLSFYESVVDYEGKIPHCFEIKHGIFNKPSQIFSCESDERRKTWAAYITEALQQAHLHSGDNNKLSADSDEGIADIAKKSTSRKSKGPLPPLPAIPVTAETTRKKKYKEAVSEYDLEESEDDDDEEDPYDDIKEHHGSGLASAAWNTPKSPTATKKMVGGISVLPGMCKLKVGDLKRDNTISKRPAVPLPTVARKPSVRETASAETEAPLKKPDYINNVFQKEHYFYDSDDKISAKGCLQSKLPGTFLVRKSKSTAGHVLTIQTESGVKEFVIREENAKVSLGLGDWFPSLDALLCFYNQHKIPKSDYDVKLLEGYNL